MCWAATSPSASPPLALNLRPPQSWGCSPGTVGSGQLFSPRNHSCAVLRGPRAALSCGTWVSPWLHGSFAAQLRQRLCLLLAFPQAEAGNMLQPGGADCSSILRPGAWLCRARSDPWAVSPGAFWACPALSLCPAAVQWGTAAQPGREALVLLSRSLSSPLGRRQRVARGCLCLVLGQRRVTAGSDAASAGGLVLPTCLPNVHGSQQHLCLPLLVSWLDFPEHQ